MLNLSPIPLVCLLFFFLFLCFLTIVWAAVPLLSLSVFLALFHQPVVHRPIFHPASPPSVSCRIFIFLLSIFPALVFYVSHLPVWQLQPPFFFFPQTDHAVSWYSDIAGVKQSGHQGLTGWIVCCHPSLSQMTTWDFQSHGGGDDTGQRRQELHENRVASRLFKLLMELVKAPGHT